MRQVFILSSVAVIVALVMPFKVPYSIKTSGKLVPAKEWILSKGSDGRLIESLFDHQKGVSESFSVTQFDRGDAVQFKLNDDLASNSTIVAGDTVGSIRSSDCTFKRSNKGCMVF